MSEPLTFTLPPEVIETIIGAVTARVVERIREKNGRSPWLTAAEAADYLRWPVKRVLPGPVKGHVRVHRAWLKARTGWSSIAFGATPVCP